ncbi:MAG: bifunctional 2-C-methyl-D-erythritol 4-phosphate cytidylyltransferase/2-C-methyl-D-erythritol 2,4-cyclodiphosphate synthase [Parvibaculaceae bacterium]
MQGAVKTVALIVAGGSGTRAGGEKPKQYQAIAGEPVLRRTVRAFFDHPGIDRVQVVIAQGHEDWYAGAVEGLALPAAVRGGTSRQESVFNGLQALGAVQPELVLIHDAARPFPSQSLLSHVIAALDRHPAVIPALPVTDTLKKAQGNIVQETVDRAGLWGVQTPQGFRYPLIAEAHRLARAAAAANFTDDASIAEWAGLEVALIPGEHDNRKITTAADLAEADARLSAGAFAGLGDIRVGQGFDVHSFVPGERVVLCGVSIPHSHALSGHSDADAPMHALTDALLGTIGEGDIGTHFPPSDPQWRGADSAIFLRKAIDLVAARGGRIANADITIIAEAPRIGPHVVAMRKRLGELLGIPVDRVAVKATTNEKLGSIGRGEGLCAFATVTVRLPG